jgi:hypothetical protein
MDLGLTSPTRLYTEQLPDGGPGREELWGQPAVDPGSAGYVFFTALDRLNRMDKDGGGLTAFATVVGQSTPTIDSGFVYWRAPNGALLRAPEQGIPACDSGSCAEVVIPAGTTTMYGPPAFDDTFAYWHDSLNEIARVRKDGTSTAPEVLARHEAISGLAVDDVAVYYTTQSNNGQSNTGSFWRIAK